MKLAFYGAGRVVDWQLENFRNNPNISVLGCYDTSPVVRSNLINNGFNAFDTIEELIASAPDVIAISTPSDNHFDAFTLLHSLADPDCIFTIEKPTFLLKSHFTDSTRVVASSGRKVFPIFQNRYNNAIQFAKSKLQSGELGSIMHGSVNLSWCRPQRYYNQADWRGRWNSDGGCLTNQGIHYIDLTRYLFGEIESVIFAMDRVDVDIECENVACGILRSDNERLISLNVNTVARPEDHKAEIIIYCDNGFINIGGIAANQIVESSVLVPNGASEDIPHAYGYGHTKFYEKLSNAIKTHDFTEELLSTLEDSQKTHNILYAAYTSALLNNAKVSTSGPFLDILGTHPDDITPIFS